MRQFSKPLRQKWAAPPHSLTLNGRALWFSLPSGWDRKLLNGIFRAGRERARQLDRSLTGQKEQN